MKKPPTVAREILKENLRVLAQEGSGFPTSQREAAALAGVGEGTLSRARRGETNVSVDALDLIARAYKLQAWQLLVQGFTAPSDDGMRTVSIQPRIKVNNNMELPQDAIDVAVAWLALPERERNQMKREIEQRAAPYRDPAAVGDGHDAVPVLTKKAAKLTSMRTTKLRK